MVVIFEAGSSPAPSQTLRPEQLAPLPRIIEEAIRSGQIPGAVVLVGNQGKGVYRQAFGYRSLQPKKVPMVPSTLFDLASLTKVVATTIATLQLLESGKVNLEDKVATYWPEFRKNDKDRITLRHLLIHYSGLRPSLPLRPDWSGYDAALQKIVEEAPFSPPDTRFVYSDLNFIILGELIRRISGQPFDAYCHENIFKPVGMKDTSFNPAQALYNRLAPTKENSIGEVHDPLACRMEGVAGHAGLFSTAEDLAIFAQTLLDGGRAQGGQILSPLMVDRMTAAHSPPDKLPLRGLGWDIHSPFGSTWSESLPPGSYGHRGFTGTLLWIDPISKTYLIVLTNRVYLKGRGNMEALWTRLISVVAEAVGRAQSPPEIFFVPRSMDNDYSGPPQSLSGKVETGIDALVTQKFDPLSGLRLGLITNQTGLDSKGRRTLDLLFKAPKLKLKVIFSPEHGLSGKAEGKIPSSRDPATRLPVLSLYGNTLRPTAGMLKDLDALVFDVQDAGVRFYTYITTMGYALEAAAQKGISFFVLDRPNPISASIVQGPILDKDLESFTGYFPLPVRHGMTVGELARMFNAEKKIGARLQVVRMTGYRRGDWYDQTGLPWVNPSPNLRSLTQAILYPGVGMVEGANVSVGRGTLTPFEVLGSPWIQGKELAEYLNHRRIPGVEFRQVNFIPGRNRFKDQVCRGVQIMVTDRQVLDAPALGVEIISALYRLYPKDFEIDKTLPSVGARWVLEAVREGKDPPSILMAWQEPLERFLPMRGKYLLY